jgi:nucleoside-diphosphate-sugar epimerase
MKRILIVGGTGFLGYHAIVELLRKGYEITALGLPPAPPHNLFPPDIQIILQSVETATDEDLFSILRGQDALVYAAGMDDRTTPGKPAYPKFFTANVEVPARVLRIAVQAGVKRAVVLGSYFAHFDRLIPDKQLAIRHPYIRSRKEQEQVLVSIPGMETCVLELPYIFGSLPAPGWRPLWTPLIKYLRSSKIIFYMKGGTACISARVTGRAILSALERGKAGACYPIGQENLTWIEMLSRLANADGRKIKVVTLPTWLIGLAMHGLHFWHTLQGRQSGLDMRHFSSIQTANTFIDPQISQAELGYELDELEEAFRDTIRATL